MMKLLFTLFVIKHFAQINLFKLSGDISRSILFKKTVTGLCLSYVFINDKFRQVVCFDCLYTFPSQ